eukprot:2705183-Karenia_brevis.AAC.1
MGDDAVMVSVADDNKKAKASARAPLVKAGLVTPVSQPSEVDSDMPDTAADPLLLASAPGSASHAQLSIVKEAVVNAAAAQVDETAKRIGDESRARLDSCLRDQNEKLA